MKDVQELTTADPLPQLEVAPIEPADDILEMAGA
jgi:hypothetical protein